MSNPSVLERSVIHAGKVFIKAGEENSRAYVIQQGMVEAFTLDEEGNRVPISKYGPGTIIGEVCLMLDEPIKMSFETLVDTTVVTITRQDFEQKLTRMDKTVKKVLNHLMKKLYSQDDEAISSASELAEMDSDAFQLVQGLIGSLSPDKKALYEEALLPHMNGLIKAIKKMKDYDRHQQQAADVAEKVAKVKDE